MYTITLLLIIFKILSLNISTSFSGRIRFYQCSDLPFFKNINCVISSYSLHDIFKFLQVWLFKKILLKTYVRLNWRSSIHLNLLYTYFVEIGYVII